MFFFVYIFTVRDGDTVKHYRIRQLDEGGFFIARRTTFRYTTDLKLKYTHIICKLNKYTTKLWHLCTYVHKITVNIFYAIILIDKILFRTLQELVEHYSKDSDGLCVNLCKPCVQVIKCFFILLAASKKKKK